MCRADRLAVPSILAMGAFTAWLNVYKDAKAEDNQTPDAALGCLKQIHCLRLLSQYLSGKTPATKRPCFIWQAGYLPELFILVYP